MLGGHWRSYFARSAHDGRMVLVWKIFENEACEESAWWHYKEGGACVLRPHQQSCHCVIRNWTENAIKIVVGYLQVVDTIDADNYALT